MAGPFDDLIPAKSAAANPFQDLMPNAPTPVQTQTIPAPEMPNRGVTVAPKGGVPYQAGAEEVESGALRARGSVLPFERNLETGETSLALPTMLDPAKVPGDVYSGKTDLNTPEGQRAAFEAATLMTPGAPAAGATPKALAPAVSKPRIAAQPKPAMEVPGLPPRVQALRDSFLPDGVPTTAQLESAKRALYQEADRSGVAFTKEASARLVNRVRNELKGHDRDLHPAAAGLLRRFEEDGARPLTMSEVDILRKLSSDVAASKTPGESMFGSKAIGAVDDFLDKVPMSQVIAGDKNAALATLKEARSLNTRFKKSELFDKILANAEDKAGANYTQAALETALRQEFRAISKKINENHPSVRSLTAEEKALVKDIVRGNLGRNIARGVGKFAPRGVISGAIMGTVATTNPVLGVPLWMMSEAGRYAARRGTMGSVNALQKSFATGSKNALVP